MNKKVLMLTISILTISIMITPMIGTAQAWGWGRSRTIETFYVEPFVDPPTLSNTVVLAEGDEKCVKDDTIKIVWGEIKKSNYNGPLGTGYQTREVLIGAQDCPLTPSGKGWTINKMTIEITDGPFGKGILKGFAYSKFEFDMAKTPKFEMWQTQALTGTGNLKGLRVRIEGYTAVYPPYPPAIWHTKTVVIS
jgi:hypothetical protein